MAKDIHKLIGAVCPTYAKSSCKDKVKEIVSKGLPEGGYLNAVSHVELVEPQFMDFEKEKLKNAIEAGGLKNPIEKHVVEYDLSGNPTELLEQLYFWLLDKIRGDYGKVDKLMDNFIASPGSGLFTDFLSKTTRVQEEASRIMGNVNTVIRSILNLLYDLKELKMVLQEYDNYKTKKGAEKEASLLTLKQRWLDQVDIKKGGTALKQLVMTGANQPNFVLVIDAFMHSKTLEEAKELDVNERVKRLVLQRLSEFFIWIDQSHAELKKRFDLEKLYLQSQVNSVKLYARWAKPYLIAAKKLEQNATDAEDLVTGFNTALFEFVLFGQGDYKIDGDIENGVLPSLFKNVPLRKFHHCVIVELKLRSTPETVGQHHRFRGKLNAVFTGYALNEDEVKVFKEQVAKDDFGDIFGAIEGATDNSIAQLQADLDEVLETKKENKDEEEDKDVNPFSALLDIFSIFKSKKKDEKKDKGDLSKGIPKDNDYEKVVRSLAIIKAREECNKLFTEFKKRNSMPAF